MSFVTSTLQLDFDGRRIHGVHPFEEWEWRDGDAAVRGDALADLRRRWEAGRARFPRGGLIGFFGYDFARSLEPRAFGADTPSPRNSSGIPDARWTFFEELHAAPGPATTPFAVPGAAESPRLARVRPAETGAAYEHSVRRILEFIAAGDIYQANLTRRFEAEPPCAPRELYRRLQEHPMPMSALLEYDDFALVSHSPERFWSLHGNRISAHPIKGTRPRGTSPADDAAERDRLRDSAKDRAENVMIVDLLRNDLGRVCEYGSVTVPQLFEAVAYPTVWHGVSTVCGTLRNGCDVFDAIGATFPCGSITGAPKIRAMQIIDSLEPVRRGASMGAIGYIGFDGNADFNVAIRTATCAGGRVHFHAGGGIVADSEVESERHEIEVKTRALRAALAWP